MHALPAGPVLFRVMTCPACGAAAKRVFGELAQLPDHRATIDQLTDRLAIQRSAVHRALTELIACGHILVTPVLGPGPTGATRSRNVYELSQEAA